MKRILSIVALALGTAFASIAGVSPDGKLTVELATDKSPLGPQNHSIKLADAETGRIRALYKADAREVAAYWSPDSRMVALNVDITHVASDFVVYRIVKGGWKPLPLPPELQGMNVPAEGGGTRVLDVATRYVKEADRASVAYWIGSHGLTAERWLNATDLEISLGGEAMLGNGGTLELERRFWVRFENGKSRLLDQKEIRYELHPPQPAS